MTTPPLDFITSDTGQNPKHIIIWLHGLGADGHDFEGIVPEIHLKNEKPLRFIFPHAPVIPVTINNGSEMRAWYDIKNIDFQREPDLEQLNRSSGMIKNLADDQINQGIKPENIILAGFSQGGVIALHTGISLPYKIAGIAALSCYIADKSQIIPESECKNGKTEIFIGHGLSDNVVPFRLGQQMAAVLTMNNYFVRFKKYEMMHEVCSKEIQDLSGFIDSSFFKPEHIELP